MRVITGEFKGRKLESPAVTDKVRPTSDKVKEAMFDILMNDIYGSTVIDLFAGSGALGIEALSRGADKCYFVDSDRSSIRLIKQNISIVGAEDRSVVLACDYAKALEKIKEKADIILIDPPYQEGYYRTVLSRIDILDLLDDEGIIITEYASRDEMPEETGSLKLVKTRKYGKTSLGVYRKAVPESR